MISFAKPVNQPLGEAHRPHRPPNRNAGLGPPPRAPSLCVLYAGAVISQSRFDLRSIMFPLSTTGAQQMLDLVYLVVGLGGFGLMAGYAMLCSRL
jgi:hypothetical protein